MLMKLCASYGRHLCHGSHVLPWVQEAGGGGGGGHRGHQEMVPALALININHADHRTICDIMNTIESSKIVFSEVHQHLHITLTIPVTSATAE